MSEKKLKTTLKKLLGREINLIIGCKVCHTNDIGYKLCPRCGGSVCDNCLEDHLQECIKWHNENRETIKNQVCW